MLPLPGGRLVRLGVHGPSSALLFTAGGFTAEVNPPAADSPPRRSRRLQCPRVRISASGISPAHCAVKRRRIDRWGDRVARCRIRSQDSSGGPDERERFKSSGGLEFESAPTRAANIRRRPLGHAKRSMRICGYRARPRRQLCTATRARGGRAFWTHPHQKHVLVRAQRSGRLLQTRPQHPSGLQVQAMLKVG